MRVDQTLTGWWNNRSAAGALAGGGPARSTFEQVLGAQVERLGREQLQQALRDVDEAAERLERRLTWDDLLQYKRALQSFLEIAVRLGLVVKEEAGTDRRGRPQLYKLLAVLDERVLEMAEVLQGRERDRMRLLALIGEVRGLLVHVMI